MNTIYASILALSLVGCGSYQPTPTATTPTDTTTTTDTAALAASDNTATKLPGGYLQGYVVSAFDMTVDGTHYADSESFYSAELDSLQSQADAAGYQGYSMVFAAQIGLDDLKYGMDVYVAAEGGVGYATDTKINEKGQFTVSIPNGSGGDTKYQIRTNKRVSVTLTSPDKSAKVKWCYNFSGSSTEGQIGAPVIINTFTSTLTKYDCDVTSSGILIPQNPAAPATVTPATAPSTGTSAATTPAAG